MRDEWLDLTTDVILPIQQVRSTWFTASIREVSTADPDIPIAVATAKDIKQ